MKNNKPKKKVKVQVSPGLVMTICLVLFILIFTISKNVNESSKK